MKIDRESMIGDYAALLKELDQYIAAISKFRSDLPSAEELLPEGNEDTNGYYFHYFNITALLTTLEESSAYVGM